MKNPFVFGKEVSGDNFCNRKKEIEELTRDAESSQNVLIYSQRRYGKTSLIKEVLRKVQKEGIITVYIDLYPVTSEVQLIKTYANAIANSFQGSLEKKVNQLKGIFRRLRPTITINSDGSQMFSVEVSPSYTEQQLEDAVESINTYIKKNKKYAVIVFDEFQQIGEFKTNKAEKIMRSMMQSHKRIAYFFMGSKKHLIFDMFNNPSRPFYKSSKQYPLEKIDADELLKFVKDKFRKGRKKIKDKTIKRIVSICKCHPYYLQYICHILWEISIDKSEVTDNDVSESLCELLRRGAATYEATWNLLTKKQREVLLELAAASPDTKIFSSEFMRKHNLGPLSSVHKALNSLMDKDLVEREKDAYIINDIFFQKWIISL